MCYNPNIKIVILSSCQYAPFKITAPLTISTIDKKQIFAFELWKSHKQERAYKEAKKIFYPAIDEADIVIAISKKDGTIGKHTQMDIDYAKSVGKQVMIVSPKESE